MDDDRFLLDQYAEQARFVLRGHLAVVSVFSRDWQHFVGAAGLPTPYDATRRVPLLESFCRHAREIGAQLIVPDTAAYPSLATHPIGAELGLVSYVAWPVVDADGQEHGILTVFDRRPRDWSTAEVAVVEHLALRCAEPVRRRTQTVLGA